MGRLIYAAITSLDGYVADADGTFDWSAPGEEVHAFVNDLERGADTALYGRRMYEVLKGWETMGTDPDEPEVIRDFGTLWRAADKIVYSRTLERVETANTRIERELDPDAVRALKADTDRDLTIGGAELAGQALAAGLVDEVHLLISPVLVGGGTSALPDGVRLDLELLDERRFADGVVYLRYRTSSASRV